MSFLDLCPACWALMVPDGRHTRAKSTKWIPPAKVVKTNLTVLKPEKDCKQCFDIVSALQGNTNIYIITLNLNHKCNKKKLLKLGWRLHSCKCLSTGRVWQTGTPFCQNRMIGCVYYRPVRTTDTSFIYWWLKKIHTIFSETKYQPFL